MSTICLTAQILNRRGAPLIEGGEPLTVRDVAFIALDTPLPDDARMGPAAKLRLAQAGLKIAAAGDTVELSADVITLLLDRLSAIVNTLVYGQMVAALDPVQLGEPS